MSIGLIALLDDIAGLAKVAAASLDDVGLQAAKAGAKAAGVVIDDAAVTPRYVVGFAAARELPIVGRIALGSLKNKLIYLLPAALLLSLFAPWAITPLLMIGGAYLCYEGSEKVFEALFPHGAHQHEAAVGEATQSAQSFEDEKVGGAIKTDFILSAEIMAITLASIPAGSFTMQATVLAVVGIGITALVYGGVALIVKADDAGVAMAASNRPVSRLFGRAVPGAPPSAADRALAPLTKALGRGLVKGMPVLLKLLSVVGTAAMIWVGGGIIVHGLEGYGFAWLGHAIHDAAVAAGHAVPALGGLVEWLVSAAGSGLVGLVLGGLLIPLIHYIAVPLLRAVRGGGRKAGKHTA
jgi:predicted DNA repair protein MutK